MISHCRKRAPYMTVALVCLMAQTGCTDLITITTTPPGARVTLDGVYRGETPLVTHVEWWAWRQNVLKLEKKGFATFEGGLIKGWRSDYIALDAQLLLIFGAGLFAAPFNVRGPKVIQHFDMEAVK